MTIIADIDPRARQRELLQLYLHENVYPPAIGVHGPHSSGKSYVLLDELQKSGKKFTWVQCDQCATVRIMLQRALRDILLKTDTGTGGHVTCENVDAFYSILAEHFHARNYTKQHVLVLDRIDRIPELSTDVYTCLPRLPELAGLDNVLVTFVYSTTESRLLVGAPIPHLFFPRYTPAEVERLVAQTALLPEDAVPLAYLDELAANTFWRQFVAVAVSALTAYAGSDVPLLRRLVRALWPRFIAGLEPSVSFVDHYRSRTNLFRDENLLIRGAIDLETNFEIEPKSTESAMAGGISRVGPSLISNKAKVLLSAAYLASYNASRYDMRFFSKAKEARAKRRITKPKKSAEAPARALVPPTFELERLLAIYHALRPDAENYVPNTAVGTELATLHSHNLIVREGDALDSRAKWRINVSWPFIKALAADIELPIADFLLDD